ncbi:MAG: rhomboid family intramembrane serine protease [Chitinivibrionales bacterium]|nr:rhomboid family intramembrane serine protease [Chitinivibrionales bacterium]
MNSFGDTRMSLTVRNLLIANVAIFLLYNVPQLRGYMYYYGVLIPSRVFLRAEVWRPVTYLFLHGDIWHLAFNMLALWMFGVELEQFWGSKRFAVFYFVCGVGAALFSVIMWQQPIIGASGAVLGVLTAYAYYFPNRTVLLFFVFPVPVRWAVVIIGGISLWGSMGTVGGIAHITHLGGIAVALAYIRSYPTVMHWWREQQEHRSERHMRDAAEDRARRDRYFKETIDPLLKKVSEQGMDSLSRKEKKLLFEASKKDRDRFRSRGIIPFDFK